MYLHVFFQNVVHPKTSRSELPSPAFIGNKILREGLAFLTGERKGKKKSKPKPFWDHTAIYIGFYVRNKK